MQYWHPGMWNYVWGKHGIIYVVVELLEFCSL